MKTIIEFIFTSDNLLFQEKFELPCQRGHQMAVMRILQFQPFKFSSYGLWLIFGEGVFGLKKLIYTLSEKSF